MLNNVIKSISKIKIQYLPLLAIYFANSFAAFSKISETYWIKDHLTLTPSEITSITIWANLPWTMKIVFGQFLDSVKIFGSQRNIYVFFAASIMALGYFINIAIANDIYHISSFASTYHLLIISGALIQLGLALQDLVADTLCYDVVDKFDENGHKRSRTAIKFEIAEIQIIVRFIDIIAAMFAAIISGWIATKFEYKIVSYFSLVIVAISIAGVLIVKDEPKVRLEKVNISMIVGGLLYLLAIIFISVNDIKGGDIIILIFGTIIVSILIYRICQPLEHAHKIEIVKILLIIFAFRATPSYGPGVQWWQIDVLGFDANFFSILDQLSIIFSLFGVWLLSKKFIKMDIVKSLFILKFIYLIFQLPYIGMALGLHDWTMSKFGIGAKTITIIDITGEGMFQKLEFMIICYAATYYAPKTNIASWFALVMSLVSIAYIGASRILKRLLADLFVIERDSYENILALLISTNILIILLPTIALALSYVFYIKKD